MSNILSLHPWERSLVRHLLAVIESHFIHQRESIIMTVIATNDTIVRLKPVAQDRDGVTIPATGLQVTVDKPDVASVTADPANPGAFLVQPLAATDPAAGSRTVIVTTLDPASGVSVQTPIEFDPGKEASLTVNAEIVGAAQAAAPGEGTPAGATTGQVAPEQAGA